MAELPAVLKKEVGPFRVGEWILIGVGGIAAGLLIRRALGRSSSVGGGSAGGPSDEAGGPLTSSGGLIAGPDRSVTTDTNTAIESNDEWRQAAVRLLTGNGVDALDASEAVGVYLLGSRQLEGAERQWIADAIESLGPPPQAPPEPYIVPDDGHAPDPEPDPMPKAPDAQPKAKPAPKAAPTEPAYKKPYFGPGRTKPQKYTTKKGDTWAIIDMTAGVQPGTSLALNRYLAKGGQSIPGTLRAGLTILIPPNAASTTSARPTPSAGRTHVVSSGDTLSKIAQRYYGSPSRWTQIYNANRAVIGGDPNRIRPGQRLVIP